MQIRFYQVLVFFQASFRIETWVSSQLQVSILDDVEARPCLLFRGHETNQYLVHRVAQGIDNLRSVQRAPICVVAEGLK